MRALITRFRLVVASMTFACGMLLAGPLVCQLTPASAAVGVCRSDPVFTMANGQTLTLNETVTDVKTDITGGSYVLHIPTGRKIVSVSYSGTIGSTQSMTWYADQPANTFNVTSDVFTKTAKIPVTAYATIGTKNSTSNTGVSNTAIPNTLVTS